ncbi:hypothetical protein AVEN_48669-1, partial [Araneus ventricosus]
EPTTSKYQEKPNLPKAKVSANSGMTPKDSIPTDEASVKTKKKSKSGQKKKKSKGGEKKKKSTNEPSLIIKLPVKQESVEDLTVRLEAGAQSADSARPRVEQEPVANATQNRQPVAQNPFSGDINRLDLSRIYFLAYYEITIKGFGLFLLLFNGSKELIGHPEEDVK